MHRTNVQDRGFILIAVLLLMLLMSGISLSMMYMVNTEGKVGTSDLENDLAYHASEGGMENLTAALGNLYTQVQSPTVAQVQALGNTPPTIPGIQFMDYSISVPLNAQGNPNTTWDTVHSGPNSGLIALITPMNLSVTAQRPLGDQVHMYRTVEVAQIPVFQFGVFSDMDLSYFPGPNFNFAGRVHTNGNLFLASGSALGFTDKITVVGEVVRAQLSNGWLTSSNYTGNVVIPDTASGCVAPPANPTVSSTCINMTQSQGSVVGGPTSAQNPQWSSISMGTYNSYIINHTTGATALTLPFVGGGATPIQIIRRPPPGELASSLVGTSRLYNQAEIRIQISDTPQENHPDGSAVDANDVELVSQMPAALTAVVNLGGASTAQAGINVSGVGTSYFGEANITNGGTCTGSVTGCEPNYSSSGKWYIDLVPPPFFHGVATPNYHYPATYPAGTQAQVTCCTNIGPSEWPIVDGFLRVDIKKSDGTYLPVTNEWLQLGFARGLTPPTAASPNSVHPSAILIFQQLADRNGDGSITAAAHESSTRTGAGSQYNWFPINFYDPREGEPRDVAQTNNTCTPNGVMNAVELDLGNLTKWLAGSIGQSGTQADFVSQTGYVLYYSDRRGMQLDPNTNPVIKTGEYGFEDVVNSASSTGVPDGQLEQNNPGTTQSPEDVDQNGKLDNWGGVNVGDAFGPAFQASTRTAVPNPFNPRMTCTTTGRKNSVTGARHVLMLVDGAKNGGSVNLPRPFIGGTQYGGFTVGSENPVYVLGDYNASAADGTFADPHTAAAIIADSVTLLSNNWGYYNSLANSTNLSGRSGNTTWYRVAIAAGKNISFPRPTTWSASQDFGTDGGMHNFLRYIESWGGTLNYEGSLVSLYYSQYSTGVFKCCTLVYSPPTRAYAFDTLFLTPSNLPPGTPMFKDVDNVSYRQDFTPY